MKIIESFGFPGRSPSKLPEYDNHFCKRSGSFFSHCNVPDKSTFNYNEDTRLPPFVDSPSMTIFFKRSAGFIVHFEHSETR